jgi:hypothetical protein
MKLHKSKLALLAINVVGGIAVVGSYVHGFLTHPGSASALWGKVPDLLLPFYTASMLTAAAGYLAFTFFILVRLDPDEKGSGRVSYGAFLWLYAAILVPSALWMPLTFAMLAGPSLPLWAAIRVVLAMVGLASLGLFIALLGVKPASHPWARGLAIAGSILFFIQTGILDAVVWPAFFPIGS